MSFSFLHALQALDQRIRHLDYAIAARLLAKTERPQVIVLMFHLVFESLDEISTQARLPFESFTVDDFDKLINIYAEKGFEFVAASDLLTVDRPSVCLTFDDGLANNARVLPVLEKYSVPATFFISTTHVCENRAFWWDVVVRERRKQGASRISIMQECDHLKKRTHKGINEYLTDAFGKDSLLPTSDIERPLSPSELKDFAQHPLVEIGNHTAHHAILTNYSYEDALQEIQQAQDTLQEITGVTPKSISYPDGAYSDETIQAATEAGLTIGLTTQSIEVDKEWPLEIGRYQFNAQYNIEHQIITLNQTPYNRIRTALIERLKKHKTI